MSEINEGAPPIIDTAEINDPQHAPKGGLRGYFDGVRARAQWAADNIRRRNFLPYQHGRPTRELTALKSRLNQATPVTITPDGKMEPQKDV